jgi:hypothetical protein
MFWISIGCCVVALMSYVALARSNVETPRRVSSSWLVRLLILAAAFFLGGWVLVLVSGYGGNSTGGSEVLWRVGGVAVYLSLAIVLVAAVWGLGSALRSAALSFRVRDRPAKRHT